MVEEAKTPTELATFILESEVEIQKKNEELARRSETFKRLITARDELNNQIGEAKEKLKELMPEGKIERQLGDNTLSVTTWGTLKIEEGNVNEIDEDYTTEEEIFNVVKRGGRFFQKKGNTALVKNLVANGMTCPNGFIEKRGTSISIKFNGKAL